ncbi:SH3 domain-containing protein [Helicobacter sp. NHP22-001]|uniref:SH3 domain-containing protein n=1 Tax=Helicobacter sp. NHP22-001 TaxID=3040202 RepID=UPI00244D7FA3|nr:SH3 domain-containing protein [Helicobacter sp. NHP22-001]GMB96343.1 hypothetical protein NHP22001_09320 [Helicobacter sp. NHP22-001]
MAVRFFKLYGYGLGVVLLCLGMYVGVFVAEVKPKGTEQAQIEPSKVQEQEKSIEQAKEASKGATPMGGTESKENKEAAAPKSETKTLENKEASKEAKTIENKEAQKTTTQEQVPKEHAKEAKEGTKEPPYTLYRASVSVINVRIKPSTHAPVVAKVLEGQEVRVFEVKEGWGRIEKGWVYLPLLKKDQ